MTDAKDIKLPTSGSVDGHAISAGIRTHVLEPLKADFVGKDEVIDLLGVCLVSG